MLMEFAGLGRTNDEDDVFTSGKRDLLPEAMHLRKAAAATTRNGPVSTSNILHRFPVWGKAATRDAGS